MDAEFWHQRWQEGRIGFHQTQVTPLLAQHWPAIGVERHARVFVPLAGKTLDLLWLAARGHRVFGIELSPLAVQQFFEENRLTPDVRPSPHGTRHVAGPIELLCGDVFDLDEAALADCQSVYDRAALIALPPDLRQRYVSDLYAKLPSHCRGLLVTIDYPPDEKVGPPFAVSDDEVEARFAPDWWVQRLDQRHILDEQPGFVAERVTRLTTSAFAIRRR